MRQLSPVPNFGAWGPGKFAVFVTGKAQKHVTRQVSLAAPSTHSSIRYRLSFITYLEPLSSGLIESRQRLQHRLHCSSFKRSRLFLQHLKPRRFLPSDGDELSLLKRLFHKAFVPTDAIEVSLGLPCKTIRRQKVKWSICDLRILL